MTQQRACMKGSDRLSLAPALLHSSKCGISDVGNDAGADYGAGSACTHCISPSSQVPAAACGPVLSSQPAWWPASKNRLPLDMSELGLVAVLVA